MRRVEGTAEDESLHGRLIIAVYCAQLMGEEGPTEEKGELVGDGEFRIDRAAALEKLKKYQLSDPWDFVRAWARAAVLSGATRLECVPGESESILRFDGAPLPRSFVEGPYEAIFSGDDASAPRHVAIGVMAAQRLSPEGIRVRSGGVSWTWTAPDAEAGGESAPGPTELCVRWSAATADRRHAEFSQALAKACGMLDRQLVLDGLLSTPRVSRFAAQGARRGGSGRRVAVVAPAPDNLPGEVFLYRDGVRVGELVFPGFELLSVHLNDDDIKLDLSGVRFAQNVLTATALRETLEEAARNFQRADRGHGGPPTRSAYPLAAVVLNGIIKGILGTMVMYMCVGVVSKFLRGDLTLMAGFGLGSLVFGGLVFIFGPPLTIRESRPKN